MNDEKSLAIMLQQNSDLLTPAAAVETFLEIYQAKREYINGILKETVDFGPIPGSTKPALLKPGAEKLAYFFGLCPIFEDISTIEDWTGADHGGESFFYYRQKCKLTKHDQVIGTADGSCNSWEKKYRYRWVNEGDVPTQFDRSKLRTRGGRISEFQFAIEKAETSGAYGKPAEYWKRFTDAIANGSAVKIKKQTRTGKNMDAVEIDSTLYQVPNDDVAEQVNTILKMAQKRALVAAVLITTGASDYFTQDIEDFTDVSWKPAASESPETSESTPGSTEPTAPVEVKTEASVPVGTAPVGTAKAPPAAAQPEAAKTNGKPAEPVRPYAPHDLKKAFDKAVAAIAKRGLALGPDDYQITESALMNLFETSEQAEIYLGFLAGSAYLSDLEEQKVIALLRLLKPVLTSGTWIPCQDALAEARQVIEASLPVGSGS